MINNKVLNIIGIILVLLGISMIPSSLWSLAASNQYALSDHEFFDFIAILKSAFISLLLGGSLYLVTRFNQFKIKRELQSRDGFVIVTLGWLCITLLSSLPYYFSFTNLSFTNSFFESMSGLTTTGATILGDPSTFKIEDLSRGMLFWRSFTQFIGGMGIIVFSIAILPMLGIGGVQLFRAEVAGPVAEKITLSQMSKPTFVISDLSVVGDCFLLAAGPFFAFFGRFLVFCLVEVKSSTLISSTGAFSATFFSSSKVFVFLAIKVLFFLTSIISTYGLFSSNSKIEAIFLLITILKIFGNLAFLCTFVCYLS